MAGARLRASWSLMRSKPRCSRNSKPLRLLTRTSCDGPARLRHDRTKSPAPAPAPAPRDLRWRKRLGEIDRAVFFVDGKTVEPFAEARAAPASAGGKLKARAMA